jgi:hypothetical protein
MDNFKASLYDSATPVTQNVVDGPVENSKKNELGAPSPSKEVAKQNPAPFSYLSGKEVVRRTGQPNLKTDFRRLNRQQRKEI